MTKKQSVFLISVGERKREFRSRLASVSTAYDSLVDKATRYAQDLKLLVSFNREIVSVCERYLTEYTGR